MPYEVRLTLAHDSRTTALQIRWLRQDVLARPYPHRRLSPNHEAPLWMHALMGFNETKGTRKSCPFSSRWSTIALICNKSNRASIASASSEVFRPTMIKFLRANLPQYMPFFPLRPVTVLLLAPLLLPGGPDHEPHLVTLHVCCLGNYLRWCKIVFKGFVCVVISLCVQWCWVLFVESSAIKLFG